VDIFEEIQKTKKQTTTTMKNNEKQGKLKKTILQ